MDIGIQRTRPVPSTADTGVSIRVARQSGFGDGASVEPKEKQWTPNLKETDPYTKMLLNISRTLYLAASALNITCNGKRRSMESARN